MVGADGTAVVPGAGMRRLKVASERIAVKDPDRQNARRADLSQLSVARARPAEMAAFARALPRTPPRPPSGPPWFADKAAG